MHLPHAFRIFGARGNDGHAQGLLRGRVAGAAFVVAVFAWGISFYGPPIFLQHLHATRGRPISLISAAITSHYLLGTIVVANLAALYRRFGAVRITRAGALLTAAGLLGWVYARKPWLLFATACMFQLAAAVTMLAGRRPSARIVVRA
jgi:hypothetical protein